MIFSVDGNPLSVTRLGCILFSKITLDTRQIGDGLESIEKADVSVETETSYHCHEWNSKRHTF
jgi:hypothetical protein